MANEKNDCVTAAYQTLISNSLGQSGVYKMIPSRAPGNVNPFTSNISITVYGRWR